MKRQMLRILIGLSIVLAALAAMVLVGFGPTKESAAAVYPDRMDVTSDVRAAVDAAPRPRHDEDLPTAVVVMASEGANVADALPPYEVLSVSKKFNVYTAAPERRPVPLMGGLDVVPDFSFDELTQRFPDGVDVVIAPDVPAAAGPETAPVRDWLALQYRSGATVLGVCTGTELLAEAGLLDERPATSHWLGLYGLTRNYPDVKWERDARYVDDGTIITTAGVLSGIDGALRILEREADESVAQRAATAVGWSSYRPGSAAPVPGSRIRPADTVALLNVAYREPSQLGVVLTEGVGEIELASIFRPYTELSYVARPHTITLDGSPIRSRHGLTFVPRSTLGQEADRLDRLIVPGSDAAQQADPAVAGAAEDAGLDVTYMHSGDAFPFDPVLQDIAETKDVATATWVAKTLEYPVQAELSGSAWPWMSTAKLALVGLVGAAAAFVAGFAVVRLLRARPGLRRFVGHYLEMVLAMLAGMGILGGLWMLIWPGIMDRPVLHTLEMAADMTIGMAVWMVLRGHPRRMIVEMSAAMVAPFLLLLVPLAAGVITAGTLMLAGHVLMLFTMLAAMLLRRHDYTHHHGTWPWRRRVAAPVAGGSDETAEDPRVSARSR
jgi:transcriptional regulator GlxA family with amidase domain